MEEERKKAFVVFASTYEAAVNHLTLEQMGELFVKLGRYSLEGEAVHSETPMVDVILKMTIPNMDAAEERHLRAIENGSKGKDFGNRGGRPRKGETREEYDARRMERASALENPQKPLNIDKDIDINKDNNTDIDKEIDIDNNRYKEINNNINKNTNDIVNSNRVITNTLSSFENHKPEREETCQGEEPRQAASPQHQSNLYNTNLEESETKHGADPQLNTNSKPQSDFIRSISLDDEEECEVAPAPAPPRVGEDMPSKDVGRLVVECLDAAIDCEAKEGRSRAFLDHINRAVVEYMRQQSCDEEKAKKCINWLYKQRRKRRAEEINNAADGDGDIGRALEHTIDREIQTLIDCDEGKKPKTLYASAFGRAVSAAMAYYGCDESQAKDCVRRLKVEFKEL